MPKRARTTSTPSRRPKKQFKSRHGYSSVARTRGGAVRGEMKYFDTEADGTVPSSATWASTMTDPATFNTLCVPQVGAGVNQRIGKGVKIMKIKIKGTLIYPNAEGSGSSVPSTVMRILLVQDKQTNSSQMTGAQLMTAGSTDQLAPLTFQNIDNFGRFQVLKDKTVTLEDPNLAGTDVLHDINGKIRTFKINHKFKFPVNVRFNATNGGTVADIVDNSFHVLMNCNNINTISYNYVCRVSYKE